MKPVGDDRLKVALFAVLVLVAELAWLRPGHDLERWFIPGELGHEFGRGTVTDGSHGFLSRDFTGGGSEAAQVWARRNGKTAPLAHAHNLAGVFPPSLSVTHPEFFPLVGDQRMEPTLERLNWNPDLGRPDVAAHAAEVAGSYFQGNPQALSFSLAINDALIFGESAETLELIQRVGEPESRRIGKPEDRMIGRADDRKVGGTERDAGLPPNRWFRGRPDYSNLVFTFMNRAVEDLSRTHPDKYLGGLAYYWAENAPDFPVQPQVLPFLTADRSQGYDPAFRAEELALQEKWARAMGIGRADGRIVGGSDGRMIGGADGRSSVADHPNIGPSDHPGLRPSGHPALRPRLGMYDYLDGPGFLIPRIHTRLIAENIRQAWQVGFTDYYAEGEPNWGLDGPMHWLVAQLLQDPAQPEGPLLDEYYRRYFQEAAAPMRKFFERCEEQWMHQAGAAYWLKHFRNESQAEIFPSAVCRELRKYLNEAERLASRENPNSKLQSQKLAERVRLVSDAFGATERFVAMQEAREALNRRVFAAEAEGGGRKTGWPEGRMVGGAGGGRPEGRKAGSQMVGEPDDRGDGRLEGRKAGGVGAEGAAGEVQEITDKLTAFIAARDKFLAYLRDLKGRQPLALAPFELRDFTSHDPVVNALVVLGKQAVDFRPSPDLVAKLPRGWELLVKGETETWNEVCGNGWLLGPSLPARRIAGLEYGVALPAPWVSYVEPAEHHQAFFVDEEAATGGSEDRKAGSAATAKAEPALPLVHPQVLRISGTKDTGILQWSPVEEGAFYLAQVTMRGSVGPSGVAMLTFGWLDAQKRNLGHTSMRLPEGEWSESLVLSQGGFPPPGAAYGGVGVRIEHQMGSDWVEVSDFSLRTPAGL